MENDQLYNQMLHINLNNFISVAEIEAKEACEWLRAAGFPQYAQLFEGNPLQRLQKFLHPKSKAIPYTHLLYTTLRATTFCLSKGCLASPTHKEPNFRPTLMVLEVVLEKLERLTGT